MFGKKNAGGWSKGKTLVVLIPSCALVVALAVALTLVIVNGEGGSEADQDAILQQYEEIKREAEDAVKQMEDLGSPQTAGDAAVYEEELEEAYSSMNELYRDLDEAAQATEDAANQVSETSESYEELYQEIIAYYDHLEQVCMQALEQMQYLQSVIPTLEQLQQLDGMIDKLEKLPAVGGQASELASQLVNHAQTAGQYYQGTSPAPEALGQFSEDLSSFSEKAEDLCRQMSEALAAGDIQSFSSYSGQLSSSMSSLEQQLTSQVAAVVNGFASQLEGLSASVSGAMPK